MRIGVVDEINWGQQQRSTTSFHSSVNIWNKRKPFLRSEHFVIQGLGLYAVFLSTISLSLSPPAPLPLLPPPLSLSVPPHSHKHCFTRAFHIPVFLASYLKGSSCREYIGWLTLKVTLQIFLFSLSTFCILRQLGYAITAGARFRYPEIPWMLIEKNTYFPSVMFGLLKYS